MSDLYQTCNSYSPKNKAPLGSLPINLLIFPNQLEPGSHFIHSRLYSDVFHKQLECKRAGKHIWVQDLSERTSPNEESTEERDHQTFAYMNSHAYYDDTALG